MNKLERDQCIAIRGSAEAIATGVAGRLRLMAGPVNHVRFDGPAVFTVHGDADETVPVSQARSLAAAMTAAGQTHAVWFYASNRGDLPQASSDVGKRPHVNLGLPGLVGRIGQPPAVRRKRGPCLAELRADEYKLARCVKH